MLRRYAVGKVSRCCLSGWTRRSTASWNRLGTRRAGTPIHVQALRRQLGVHYISAMPTNLYGPGDNFDPVTSHVLPAMIRRFAEAKASGSPTVTIWGSGTPRREFLHVQDLARASLFLLENYDEPEPINVGVGENISIKALAELVASVVGYEGALAFDRSKPDGTPRKLLDVTRLKGLGWQPKIGLRDGLERTYLWYREQGGAIRGVDG